MRNTLGAPDGTSISFGSSARIKPNVAGANA